MNIGGTQKKFNMGQLINTALIKYDNLSFLNKYLFSNSRFTGATHINIYIDVYSITKILAKQELYDLKDDKFITVALINMVAHYREFYRHIGVETTFYIVDSVGVPNLNKQLYYGYNSKNEASFKVNKMFKQNMDSNRGLLRTLCPYLPDIHFIMTGNETAAKISSIITYRRVKNGNTSPNIIITKDAYAYQLASLCDDTFILRPKKLKGEDKSYAIANYNLMRVYALERQYKPNEAIAYPTPELYTLVLTLSRVPERNMPSVLPINKAFELSTLVNPETYRLDLYSTYNVLCEGYPKLRAKISEDQFIARFKAIDIFYQEAVMMHSNECVSDKDFINLHSPDDVKHINNVYFGANPLDLNRL